MQQPVCIALAARKFGKDDKTPARVLFRALPRGRREEKFDALAALSLDPKDWVDCPSDWRAPFLPEFARKWGDFAPLNALFVWSGAGVKPHRTWPIAPDPESLARRWDRLRKSADAEEQTALFGPERDRDIHRLVTVDLGSHVRSPDSDFQRSRPGCAARALCLPLVRPAVDYPGPSPSHYGEAEVVGPAFRQADFYDSVAGAFANSGPQPHVHLAHPGPTPLQRLLRWPRVSALGGRESDAAERARGRAANARQSLWRAGRRRRPVRLCRRRHGPSRLHRAVQGRSRAARPARSADGRQGFVRRSASRSGAKSSGSIATASASPTPPRAVRKARRACPKAKPRSSPPPAPFRERRSLCRKP